MLSCKNRSLITEKSMANRWQIAGKSLANPWQTVGKNSGKDHWKGNPDILHFYKTMIINNKKIQMISFTQRKQN